MKPVLLILSLLLSCLFNGSREVGVPVPNGRIQVITNTSAAAGKGREADCKSQALLPIRPISFSGEETNLSTTVRQSGQGRRTQFSQKFPFRIIKAGKVMDTRQFFIFREELHKFRNGTHSTGRYIHTICQLLI